MVQLLSANNGAAKFLDNFALMYNTVAWVGTVGQENRPDKNHPYASLDELHLQVK